MNDKRYFQELKWPIGLLLIGFIAWIKLMIGPDMTYGPFLAGVKPLLINSLLALLCLAPGFIWMVIKLKKMNLI